jgi:NAD+ diphosphatase
MSFMAAVRPEVESGPHYTLFYRQNQLLVDADLQLIRVEEIVPLLSWVQRPIHLGTLDGLSVVTGELTNDVLYPPDWRFAEMRALYGTLPETHYHLTGHAAQIVTWDTNHQFCSKCGAPALPSTFDRAKICTACGFMNYPRISPSMIVAVTKGNQLLMARSPHFPPDLYSVPAGFVEPGETLEQCVAREVREETGIEVKNIRYSQSQPWAYPHSIMIGFTAEYAGGDIVIDPVEIEDARWMTADEIPRLPSEASIARRLIDTFLEANPRK